MSEKLGWIAIVIGILLYIRAAQFRKRDEARWRFFLGLLFVEIGVCFAAMVALSIAQDCAYYISSNGSSHGTISYEAAPALFVITQSINAALAIYTVIVGVRCFRGRNPWKP